MWSTSTQLGKMLLLGFLVVPTIFATSADLRIDGYGIEIENNILMNVQQTEESSSTLKLSSRGLAGIAENAFKSVKDIRYLELNNNSLSDLPEFRFSNLKTLIHLSLADNGIRTLKGLFGGLENLQVLNISNNPVEFIDYGDLHGLSKEIGIITHGVPFKNINSAFLDDVHQNDTSTDDEDLIEYTQYDGSDLNASLAEDPVEFPGNPMFRAKVCIVQGKMTHLDHMQRDEILPSTCREVRYIDACCVHIRNSGIETFERGWYRIRNTNESTVLGIFLSGNNITRVTKELLNDLPASVTTVDLSGNKIERLESEIMRNTNIKSLKFDNNVITDIENDTFKYMDLVELNLNGNRLNNTKFVATLPRGMKNLYMNGNEITELSKLPKLEFHQLANWYMRDNNITILRRDNLGNLPFLKNLDLSNNRIRTLEPGCFWGLNSLKVIRLRNNEIANLDAGIFDNLKRLVVLDLGRNKLTTVTEGFRNSLPHTLDIMRLDYNLLTSLGPGSFVNVPKKLLNLEGNAISRIAQGSFVVPGHYGADLAEAIDITGGLGTLYEQYQIAQATGKPIPVRRRGIGRVNLSRNPITVLLKGSLFGITKGKTCGVSLEQTPINYIRGNVFDEF